MRFKDVKQHFRDRLDQLEVRVNPDRFGTFTVNVQCVDFSGITIGKTSANVQEQHVDRTVAKLKQELKYKAR